MRKYTAIINMVLSLLILFLVIAHSKQAHSQTNHTSEHVAFAQAVNNQIGDDCISITRNGYNVVLDGEIARYSIRVEVDKNCIRSALYKNTVTAIISWQAPTKREDGSILRREEIESYQIMQLYKGALAEIGIPASELSYRMEWLPGTHDVAISAIDIYGLKSELSDVITRVIQ